MCNIAGYIGPDRAAPILLKMREREEVFDAGCYTGIATVHEGKLHWRKVVGSVKSLIERTDAMDLPGNVGIIHGRTPGRGNWTWAHPFVNPEESFAYVLEVTGDTPFDILLGFGKKDSMPLDDYTDLLFEYLSS